MTLYDRLLAARMAGAILRVLAALVLLVALIDFLSARQRDIARHDIPWDAVLRYYFYFLPAIVVTYQAAAVSVLVAGLMVLGRAAQDNEITALLASGVRLGRIVRWPVLIALLAGIGVFAFQETAGVAAHRAFDEIDREYFRRHPGGQRPGVSWTNLEGGWTVHVMRFNKRALTGEDVLLHAFDPERVQEIRADRIFWDPAQRQWFLEDGRWTRFNPRAQWEQETERITRAPAPIREEPDTLFVLQVPSEAKTARELRADLARAQTLGLPVAGEWVDYHAKFAQPALCFIMIWLAIPFAIRLRRGGIAIGFGLSIAIGLAYLLVFFIAMGLGRLDKLHPMAAAWFANALFLGAGIFLYRRTPS